GGGARTRGHSRCRTRRSERRTGSAHHRRSGEPLRSRLAGCEHRDSDGDGGGPGGDPLPAPPSARNGERTGRAVQGPGGRTVILRRWREQDGSAAVELVLVTPLLLMFALLAVSFGRLASARLQVND